MSYTKDIVLDVKYIGKDKEKKGFSKFIYSIVITTVVLILFDIYLINSFIDLLSKI